MDIINVVLTTFHCSRDREMINKIWWVTKRNPRLAYRIEGYNMGIFNNVKNPRVDEIHNIYSKMHR
jgi:hypothetical protein